MKAELSARADVNTGSRSSSCGSSFVLVFTLRAGDRI